MRGELLLVGFWLVRPWMVPWMVSKLVEPIHTVRYTISASLALYLLVAVGATAIDRLIAIAAVLGLVVVLVVPGTVAYFQGEIKENWRRAARYVEREVRAGDAVVVPSVPLGWDRFDWYYGGAVPDRAVDNERGDDGVITAALRTCGRDSDRLWVVLRTSRVRGSGLDDSVWRGADLQLVEQRVFRGVLAYLFERTAGEGDTGALKTASRSHLRLLAVRDARKDPRLLVPATAGRQLVSLVWAR